MDSNLFRTEIQQCDWLFDLFALGYDYIANRVTPSADLDTRYPELAQVITELASMRLAETLVSADGGVPPEFVHFLAPSSGWNRASRSDLESEAFLTRLLALLRLIDQVSAGLNFFNFGLSPREWPNVRTFLRSNHNLLSKNPNRRVILKPPPLRTANWWKNAVKAGCLEPVIRGQFHHRLFHNLLRVPESLDSELAHIVLRSADDAGSSIKRGLSVAIIPLINELTVRTSLAELNPGPLRIVQVPPSCFAVEMDTTVNQTSAFAPMLADLDRTLMTLCERETHIIVMPELVVPDVVVERVKGQLRSIAQKGGPVPFLVVAGTFGRPDRQTGRVYNEAVILNGYGNELFRQRKMHAYTMHTHEQPKYALHAIFDGKPTTEFGEIIPRTLVVCDSPVLGFRISVLICEDFCQQAPGLEGVRKLHCNLVLSPVMAGTLHDKSGFYDSASQLVLDPGAVVLVGNSGALPSKQACAATDSCSLGIFASPLLEPPGEAGIHLLTKRNPRGFLSVGTRTQL